MNSEYNIPSRRQFLRNTALGTLSLGILPVLGKATEASFPEHQLVDECFAITQDYYGLGPYYKAGPPDIVDNKLADDAEPGTKLILSGIVKTLDCTKIIPNTKIDIWHANDAGAYDTAGYNLRGVAYSNEQGFYLIETILPGKYLNAGVFRPRHFHFRIAPPGFSNFVTQLYFEGDTDIPADAAASQTTGQYDATHRIVPTTVNAQNELEATWDIVIEGEGILGTSDLHLDKGIIYSAAPNPFHDELNIHYGVFQKAKISLEVFDIGGHQVAVLNEDQLTPEKYLATWRPDQNIPAGHYWVVLKINGLQVHHLKVVRG